MSVIAIQIEPHRATRVFFDCRSAAVDPLDQRRIEVAIENSIALAEPEDDGPGVPAPGGGVMAGVGLARRTRPQS